MKSKLSSLDKEKLLNGLAHMGSHGRAESEDPTKFPHTFYPVPEHAHAFDPDVALVVGPRGSGKSELFRAVIDFDLLSAIKRNTLYLRLPSLEPGHIKWFKGYPIEADFPDVLGLANFFKNRRDIPNAGLELWFAYLIRILWNEFDDKGKEENGSLKEHPGGDAEANYNAFIAIGNAGTLALDRLDARLEQEDRYFFIGYDELDTLGGADWHTMSKAITGLVAFWASYKRRWRRIRAKIFLRTDLYDRYAIEGGADLAKLAANRAEITWSERSLYAMLVKRIANSSEELFEYCNDTKIMFRDDAQLGHVPQIQIPQDARPLIDRMIGHYMGANAKKGLTIRWLPEHIRDGSRQALPRPLVRLIERAAELQMRSQLPLDRMQLLDPTSLRRSLDTVSDEHVRQSLNEWPWLEGLATRLKGENVPWERRQLERLLGTRWEDSWGEQGEDRPPVDSPREFVDYLIEVGIFRSRSDGRVDVPDLFLNGLGLKRRGGVRKK